MKLGLLYKGTINDNPTHQKTVIIETCILMLKPLIGSQTKLDFVGDFNTGFFASNCCNDLEGGPTC